MDVVTIVQPMIDPHMLPKHIGIIMDGNGRWAESHGSDRVEGHREGAKSVQQVVRAARRISVSTLTLFAFSEQNWDRPPHEVGALMELLYRYIIDEEQEIIENGIRLTAIGELTRLPPFVSAPLFALMERSSKNKGMTLCLALSYGGREDIVSAARRLAKQVASGTLRPEQIDEQRFASELLSAYLPPIDLLIRTSGELRISNFLLWHSAYAELYFTDALWPEFRENEFFNAIIAFQQRERRYGLTSAQVAKSLS